MRLPARQLRALKKIGSIALLAAATLAAGSSSPPFGSWKRLSLQPILAPQGDGFESAGTFNPAVVEKDKQIVMLYRAQGRNGTSTLGYAISDDGIHFSRSSEPVLGPEAPYEKGGGTEDPRLVKIEGTYYLTYTGYNNVDGAGKDRHEAQLCLATSSDLIHWTRHGVILPAYKGSWNVGWTKSGAIVSEKINGRYWMYYLGGASDSGGKMGVASSSDLLHWTDASDQPVASTRPGDFDSKVAEPGPPPVPRPMGFCSSTTAPTIAWFTPRVGFSSIERIRRRFWLARTRRYFIPSSAGRKWGRCPMSFSWKDWSGAGSNGCFITAAPISTSVWRLLNRGRGGGTGTPACADLVAFVRGAQPGVAVPPGCGII